MNEAPYLNREIWESCLSSFRYQSLDKKKREKIAWCCSKEIRISEADESGNRDSLPRRRRKPRQRRRSTERKARWRRCLVDQRCKGGTARKRALGRSSLKETVVVRQWRWVRGLRLGGVQLSPENSAPEFCWPWFEFQGFVICEEEEREWAINSFCYDWCGAVVECLFI